MRTISILGLALAFSLAGVSMAQEWELGGMASYGFYKNLSISSPAGSAVTGFTPGSAFGAVVGHNSYGRISGELRYTYRDNDLKLSSGGTETTFKGMAHVIHYDFLFHPRPRRGSVMQPFLAAGGGVKLYRGTGRESAYQPLDNFALLTKTQEVKPLISVGGGVRFVLAPRVFLRAEFRDYITPFPRQVITPIPGTKLSGWLNDIVPMVGISIVF